MSIPGFNKIIRYAINRYHGLNLLCCEIRNTRFNLRRFQLEHEILYSNNNGVTSDLYGEHEIIISLTTHGRRLHDVCYTIESLMQQTCPANRIVLWLDHITMSQKLPVALKKQMNRGLEIYETPDIRSYTKLIPTLKAFPDATIITVDDDVIYDFDLIERLIMAHQTTPDAIYACRIHSMEFDNNGNLLPYHKWGFTKASIPKRHFATGVGGVLYPPGSLGTEVLNEKVFLNICPTGDDIWFTAMAKLNGTPIMKVETRNRNGEDYILNHAIQDMGLRHINIGKNGKDGKNDEQIKAVFTQYGIYDLIR